MDTIKVGDTIIGHNVYRFGDHVWLQKATVLAVEPMSTRFGKPDRIVRVRIETTAGRLVDKSTLRWFSQLCQL